MERKKCLEIRKCTWLSEAIQEASSEPLMHSTTFDLVTEINHGILVSRPGISAAGEDAGTSGRDNVS